MTSRCSGTSTTTASEQCENYSTVSGCRNEESFPEAYRFAKANPATKFLSPASHEDQTITKKRSKKSMNNRIVTSACVLCAMLFAIQRASAEGGSLIPPGTPAPTMITLNQIEPRTPITNTTAVTISASGSYYLTSNINVATGDAIMIAASQVTLD